MKWAALGLGAAVLVVGVGAFALIDRGQTQNAGYITGSEPASAGVLPATSTADVLRPAPAAPTQASPPVAPPTSADRCSAAEDDNGDPTGDDSSSTPAPGSCPPDSENENENENESSADDQAGDGEAEEGGDGQRDEAGDEQDGENDNGD